MNIEKMNEQISRLEGQKAEYDERMDKKIIAMKKRVTVSSRRGKCGS